MFRSIFSALLLCGVCLVAAPGTVLADVERYMAVPLGGGYVFILDTREGHAWTWTSSIPGAVGKNGENPKLHYQGNVRKNMQPPKAPDISSGKAPVPASQGQRF